MLISPSLLFNDENVVLSVGSKKEIKPVAVLTIPNIDDLLFIKGLPPKKSLEVEYYSKYPNLKELPNDLICAISSQIAKRGFASAKVICERIKREIKESLETGKVDILIGTHKLISQRTKFKDLGLLIIDEEQKFGVAMKEKLRQMKANVDTLTLSATPIPRTLQFSMMGTCWILSNIMVLLLPTTFFSAFAKEGYAVLHCGSTTNHLNRALEWRYQPLHDMAMLRRCSNKNLPGVWNIIMKRLC